MKAALTGVGWVNTTGAGHGRKVAFRAGQPGVVPPLAKKEIFSRPFPRFGRMDFYSRIGVAAIALALKDAGLDEPAGARDVALIGSTVHGSLNTDADFYDTVIPDEGRLASPALFAYVLPNTYLGEAAIYFGLTGPAFVLCESRSSGLPGLSIAVGGIWAGEYEAVVAGICDAGAPSPFPVPDDAAQGSLFFVLEAESRAEQRPYGILTINDGGKLLFENQGFENLNDLAAMCARGFPQSGGVV